MDNGQNETPTVLPGKKEMKQHLADKMETALPELRNMLGEKKFLHRLKKAAKLLMEGLHKGDLQNKKQPKATTAKKAAPKKASSTKKVTGNATANKAAEKHTTAKKVNAASAKKTKAAKKAKNSK